MKATILFIWVFLFTSNLDLFDKQCDNIEHEIINSILLDYIGNDPIGHFPPPPPILPNASIKDSTAYRKYLKEYEKAKVEFRTKRKVVFLNDTLFDYKDNMFDELIKDNNPGLQNIDEYKQLLISLTTIKRESKLLNIKLIENCGDYEFEYISKSDSLTGNFVTVANIYISRMVLNENLDKACFYLGYHCGKKCGYGRIIYVAKQNNKWVIVKKDELWVS